MTPELNTKLPHLTERPLDSSEKFDRAVIKWGAMMATCHLTLLKGDEPVGTLMISSANHAVNSTPGAVPGLAGVEKEVSRETLKANLPPQAQIVWENHIYVALGGVLEFRGKSDLMNLCFTIENPAGFVGAPSREQLQQAGATLSALRDAVWI
jgi:hypothetical protein